MSLIFSVLGCVVVIVLYSFFFVVKFANVRSVLVRVVAGLVLVFVLVSWLVLMALSIAFGIFTVACAFRFVNLARCMLWNARWCDSPFESMDSKRTIVAERLMNTNIHATRALRVRFWSAHEHYGNFRREKDGRGAEDTMHWKACKNSSQRTPSHADVNKATQRLIISTNFTFPSSKINQSQIKTLNPKETVCLSNEKPSEHTQRNTERSKYGLIPHRRSGSSLDP